MADKTLRQIAGDGLWHNNVAFVQILGLCPLLAVTSNVVNGLGLGLATLLTLVLSNLTVSAIRNLIRPDIRIAVFVMLIASIVTAIDLAMSAWFHELHGILGIFIPLIVTNCSILGRAEAFAAKNNIGRSLVDGLTMGLGFTAALVTLGAMRELLGSGTLFDQAHLMFGEAARAVRLTVFTDYKGFLLAILPPGAFIGLGLLVALKNVIDARLARRSARTLNAAAAESPAA
jgi:electron transport complex protein RnfE